MIFVKKKKVQLIRDISFAKRQKSNQEYIQVQPTRDIGFAKKRQKRQVSDWLLVCSVQGLGQELSQQSRYVSRITRWEGSMEDKGWGKIGPKSKVNGQQAKKLTVVERQLYGEEVDEKHSPSCGQNGQLVQSWRLVHSGRN